MPVAGVANPIAYPDQLASDDPMPAHPPATPDGRPLDACSRGLRLSVLPVVARDLSVAGRVAVPFKAHDGPDLRWMPPDLSSSRQVRDPLASTAASRWSRTRSRDSGPRYVVERDGAFGLTVTYAP
jgi:hypothetical protein